MMAIGGISALRHRDGQQATTSPTNGTNTLVGVQEMNALVFVRRRELIADTAGAGRFRSGMVIRTMRDLAAELRDLKHGFVSAETAPSIYRVAFAAGAVGIDIEKTNAMRLRHDLLASPQ
jgi:N-methylhydantoinase B/oxoprolinase/acetone carboxylase alpha subunit